VILHVARWPIVCWAFLNVLLRITHPYMITPKGNSDHLPPFTLRGQAVYLALVWLSGATIWFYLARDSEPEIQGYLLFALVGLVLMLTVVAANVALDFAQVRRRGIGLLRAARLRSAPLGALLATIVFAGITTGGSRAEIVMAATWVSDPAVESGSAAHAHEILRRAAAGETVEAVPPSGGTPDPLDSASGDLAQAEPTANGVPNTSSPRLQAAVAAQPMVTPLDLPPNRVAIGAYDPNLRYTSLPIEFNQWFVRQDEPDLLAGALAIGRYRRTVFVTVEPFPSRGQREPPLDTVAAGRADEQLRRLARVVRDAEPQVVLLRWGHEMELSGLYPWAANTPDLYRSAYRRVVSVFRDEGARNARWVWSPAGNANAPAYYPGDDVVDYVGLTILADENWDAGFGLPPQSFAELLRPRYERVREFGKPIIVAELGVSGSPERQLAWLSEAAGALPAFPQVQAIGYFNDLNSANNRLPTQPNWQLAPAMFRAFRAEATAARALASGAE